LIKYFRKAVRYTLKYYGYDVISSMQQQSGKEIINYTNELEGFNPKVIFDIGANLGQSAIKYSKEFPNAKIYSFEPVDSTYTLLKRNVQDISNVLTGVCQGSCPFYSCCFQ
jgi:precorrin-6B methylase 2